MKIVMDGAVAAKLWGALYRMAKHALAPLPCVPPAGAARGAQAGVPATLNAGEQSKAYREGYNEKLKLCSAAVSPYAQGSIENADWCRGCEDAIVERSL
jgi:hypothetical protein